jgi:hypothetical protein
VKVKEDVQKPWSFPVEEAAFANGLSHLRNPVLLNPAKGSFGEQVLTWGSAVKLSQKEVPSGIDEVCLRTTKSGNLSQKDAAYSSIRRRQLIY